MGLQLVSTPRAPTGYNTHTLSASQHTYYYYPNAVMENGTVDNLDLTIYRPAGIDASTPLPAIVWCNIGSFSVSPPSTGGEAGPWGAGNETQAAWFTQCGMICAILRLPIQQDDPVWMGYAARGATTELARRIDAIIEYAMVALRWVRSNPDTSNWTVEPNWVFYGGASSGGITSMCGAIRHYPTNIFIPGLIEVITSFGANNALLGLDYVDEVRTELGHTESQLTSALPICHFSVLNDTVLSEAPPPSYQTLLNDQITSFGSPSIVHLDDRADPGGDGHHSLHLWDEPDGLTGASTIEEAIYNFVSGRCASVAKLSGTLQLG